MPLDDALGPDPVDVAIGARMRLRRKSLGISQGVLSERVGVSFQQIQKYERGANRVSGSMLVAIAAALDTTVGWSARKAGCRMRPTRSSAPWRSQGRSICWKPSPPFRRPRPARPW